jgi:hypothetical protein
LSKKIKWFRVPVIFLSALGSLFGFGLSPYLSQNIISELCSTLSLVVGLIGSLEIFLGLNTKMENELIQSKELYLFAIEIQKTLLLDINHRHCDGMIYLEDKFNMYSKFIQDSFLLECQIIDELTPLPVNYQKKIFSENSSNKLSKLVENKRTILGSLIMSPRNIKNNKIEPVKIIQIEYNKGSESPVKKSHNNIEISEEPLEIHRDVSNNTIQDEDIEKCLKTAQYTGITETMCEAKEYPVPTNILGENHIQRNVLPCTISYPRAQHTENVFVQNSRPSLRKAPSTSSLSDNRKNIQNKHFYIHNVNGTTPFPENSTEQIKSVEIIRSYFANQNVDTRNSLLFIVPNNNT